MTRKQFVGQQKGNNFNHIKKVYDGSSIIDFMILVGGGDKICDGMNKKSVKGVGWEIE
jgi:hypothetical protein